MIRCPNCNQSFHAFMRGGAFIAVSLDGERLLVDTNEDMKNSDFLNPDDLGKDSTLICPQCGKIAGAYEWRAAWNRAASSLNQTSCRCGGEFRTNGQDKVCLKCNQDGNLLKKYPAIKMNYKELRGHLINNIRSIGKVNAFGWCDYS